MARIALIDETAAAERMSSDASSNAIIGSGAPLGKLTAAGAVFANAHAQIAAQRSVPLSVNPTSGSVAVPRFGSTFGDGFGNVTISTSEPSQVPVGCCDGGSAPDELTGGFPNPCATVAETAFVTDIPLGSTGGQLRINNRNAATCIGDGTDTTNYYYI